MESKAVVKASESNEGAAIVKVEKSIADTVLNRVAEMQKGGWINLPQTYSAANALKSAWLLILQTKDLNNNPALQVCTKDSIANALLDMCVQGLSPMKKQCYFIVYGNQLTMFRSYFGTQAVLKRLNGVEKVFAQPIYEGDVFEYSIDGGDIDVMKHEQRLENIDNKKIIGAYAVIVEDGKRHCTVMNKAQIDIAWSKRKNKGQVQQEFPEEMSKRTVINRAAKAFVNTSDDSDILCDAINRTTAGEYGDVQERADFEVAAFGNQEALELPEAVESVEVKEVKEEAKQQREDEQKQMQLAEEPDF